MILGVFDSGVGGLTVLRELERQMPTQKVLYFADTARLPYGIRTAEEICLYVREILQWFSLQGAERVLMACNTSSALALPDVAAEFAFPVDGLITAAARAALPGRRIGVIATAATVASGAYGRALRALDPRVQVHEVACPEFVPLVESGRILSAEARAVARTYLAPLIAADIDTLIYGCTHYPYLAPVIDQLLPVRVRRIDPAVAAVATLKTELGLGGEPALAEPGTLYRFCVSGDAERFAQAAYPWLGYYPAVCSVKLPAAPAGQTSRRRPAG